jgi:hypothetical protein
LIIGAAAEFTETWAELATSLPDDYGCEMTCSEAEALARLFRACGQGRVAKTILAEHAKTDEPDDAHHTGDGAK